MCRKITSHWQFGSNFSLRKWRRQPHFPTKLAAAASFSYKIGGDGLIFLQNWRRWQGFGNITGGCSDMVWILGWGIGGRKFMLVRGENLPMKYPWERGNLGGQVENVYPLGAEKGQSLPSSALSLFPINGNQAMHGYLDT